MANQSDANLNLGNPANAKGIVANVNRTIVLDKRNLEVA